MLKTVLDRFQRLNPLLFACMAGLIVIGVAFVYSACSVREDPELRMLYMRHAEVGVAGLAAYLLLAWVDYRTVIHRWGWLVYLACLVLLILVPLIGEARMGARRWLFGIQPSEPAKLAVVMLLAWLYSRRDAKRGTVMFLLTLVAVGVPAALILAQPDLGTAMVLVPTVFAMLFTARVAPRIVWSCVLAGAAGAALILGLIYTAEKSNLPR